MAQAGKVELALVMEPLWDITGLKITYLRSFKDVFVAGPAFGVLAGRVLEPRELCQYPLIGLEQGTSARRHISQWFESLGLSYEPQYSVRTSTLVLPFVEQGLGIGLVAQNTLAAYGPESGLFEIALTHSPAPRRLCLVVPERAPLSSLGQLFAVYIWECTRCTK